MEVKVGYLALSDSLWAKWEFRVEGTNKRPIYTVKLEEEENRLERKEEPSGAIGKQGRLLFGQPKSEREMKFEYVPPLPPLPLSILFLVFLFGVGLGLFYVAGDGASCVLSKVEIN